MKNKLFISDLDGTLLNDAAVLSHFSRKNLNKLIKKGLKFSVASARSVFSIKKMLRGLKLKLPVIEFNGAFISEFNTGEHLIINEISPQIKENIFFDIIESYPFPLISSFNGKKDLLYYTNALNEGSKWYINDRKASNDKRLKHIQSLDSTLDESIICFTIIDKKSKLERLKAILEEKYGEELEIHFTENNYSPGWHWLTIHDVNATKDHAIRELIKITNHNLDDLVVFGDDVNDIKMFKDASLAIAVSNAKQITKKYADLIIGDNNNDSVVKYLLNNF